jgi:hypothetical protein
MARRKRGVKFEEIKYVRSGVNDPHERLLIGTATLGVIRMEWAGARFGQVIPCNWTHGSITTGINTCMPIGHLIADAQNIVIDQAVQQGHEWVFFHEDDVLLPTQAFKTLNDYMISKKYPVVSGLYYLKAEPSEPLVYRGRGNSYYDNWKMGQKVWVDGVPTGCLLIHRSLFEIMWKESETYLALGSRHVRKVFETPAIAHVDPETGKKSQLVGTSDLYWCDRVIDKGYLKRAGWPELGRKKYPFLIDTNLFCGHIALNTGKVYPATWNS